MLCLLHEPAKILVSATLFRSFVIYVSSSHSSDRRQLNNVDVGLVYLTLRDETVDCRV